MKYREFPMRTLTILLTFIVALAFTACDGQSITPGNKNNSSGVNNGDKEKDEDPPGHSEEDDGHGMSKEEGVSSAPGFLSGSWRVARADEDKPIAHFDIIHVEGEKDISGTFLMGNGLDGGAGEDGEGLDEANGELINATYGGDKFELVWNPTQDPEEMYMVTSTSKVDNDNFKGKLVSELDSTLSVDVTITRQVFED